MARATTFRRASSPAGRSRSVARCSSCARSSGRAENPPGGKLAQACDYALGQWSRWEEYLRDGEVEIDNNWCEGSMRPLALGRKNWLHVGSPEAGPKIAAIASIVETCRRLDINLREYLLEVLPKLGEWPISRVGELTPTAWKAAQAKKS